jgi:hypothetical protein
MHQIKYFAFACLLLSTLAACNRSKPKPVSNNITKTAVVVNGKKDSVINNPQRNYGNATVSEPCVKCLLAVIQQTDSYKRLAETLSGGTVIYDVNWITSVKPIAIGNSKNIINGMAINVNRKSGSSIKKITTYLYNNADAQLYLLNDKNKFDGDVIVGDSSLTKIRNSCFWGVASAK